MKYTIGLCMAAILALTACGEKAVEKPAAQAENSSGEVFKFNKTSHSVNPQYTLYGLRHLVMNNRTYAKKYAKKHPDLWALGEEHFRRAENAFQTDQVEAADEAFRSAMEQYQVILKAEKVQG
ncbi:hypothetical protein ACM67B_09760 [Neisseria sp. CCUG17229]|uniref:hypothetical protein n=1 Tax=Neisseria sp. CCUG17229 TaxID=3392036 RepID=UPI003A0FF9CB